MACSTLTGHARAGQVAALSMPKNWTRERACESALPIEDYQTRNEWSRGKASHEACAAVLPSAGLRRLRTTFYKSLKRAAAFIPV